MLFKQVSTGIAFLSGLIGFASGLAAADDGSASALSGSYERVATRRASDVLGGPQDPSVDKLLVSDASFGNTLQWIDGTTCDNWSAEVLDMVPLSIEDPNLSDTQVPPNDPPVTVGDKRQNIGYRISCGEDFVGLLVKVDERVLVTASPSGLTNIILERALSDEEILAFQQELKSMKFFGGEPGTTWTEESLGAVSSFAEYRGAAYRFKRAAITENLLDGLGVLIPVREILGAESEERFSDYKPKLSEDTVLDYRPGLAEEIAELPPVTNETFTESVVIIGMHHLSALDNPGHWEDGNMPLGANEREYVPSDEELIASELGQRISSFVKGLSREEVLQAWRGRQIIPPTVEYDQFTFRHVDVMGSGRFFYASAPQRVVIDFSSP